MKLMLFHRPSLSEVEVQLEDDLGGDVSSGASPAFLGEFNTSTE